eukprot:scaffold7414_cov119-Isochrysis_galbana.AAC.3
MIAGSRLGARPGRGEIGYHPQKRITHPHRDVLLSRELHAEPLREGSKDVLAGGPGEVRLDDAKIVEVRGHRHSKEAAGYGRH